MEAFQTFNYYPVNLSEGALKTLLNFFFFFNLKVKRYMLLLKKGSLDARHA